MNILELFPCSGGLAEGFRRAGLAPTLAVDFDADACASYEANHGHRPVQMDVRDLLRMIRAGWSPGKVDLLLSDPPCVSWSRAGKRLGTNDERDMLTETVDIIRELRPRYWLIANVPGLDDGPNWPVVQDLIGGLSKDGWCIDFARLDAADAGVPQHRIRPFWVGHWKESPCIQWPERTHGSPEECAHPSLPGVRALKPWVTCRQALQHLSPEELGTPVRLRWRGANSAQHGSVAEKPARVVGTSNLSDGNVLVEGRTPPRNRQHRNPGKAPRNGVHADEPSATIRAKPDMSLFDGPDHAPTKPLGGMGARGTHMDEPARTLTCSTGADGRNLFDGPNHRPSRLDAPARTLTRNTHGDGALLQNDKHPINTLDAPSYTVTTKGDGRGAQGACVMAWPWDRPATTVQKDDRIPPPGYHDEYATRSMPGAVKLSEKAATILQGFPSDWKFLGATKRARWSMLGQAMCPPLAEVVARAVAKMMGIR